MTEYKGKIKVEGRASWSGSESVVKGSGEFSANDKYVAGEFSRAVPDGVGHAMDSAVSMHKEYYPRERKR